MCAVYFKEVWCTAAAIDFNYAWFDNRPNIVSIVYDHHVSGDIYTETPWMQNGTIRTRLGYRNHLDKPEAVKRLVWLN